MPLYRYNAALQDGRTTSGELEASSEADLRQKLLEKSMLLLNAKKTGSSMRLEFHLPGKKVNLKDQIALTRQLRVLLKAGLPMLEAIEILQQQDNTPALNHMLREIHTSIKEGKSLSDAMGNFPETFANFFRFSVKAGEASGSLEQVLDRLGTHLERLRRARGKFLAALLYPAILALVATGVVIFLLVSVVPTFSDIFADLSVELPIYTRLLLSFARGFRYNLLIIIVLIMSLAFIYRSALSSRSGKILMDRLILKIPFIGGITLKYASLQMCRTLSTLLASGVPMVEALATTSLTIGNLYLASSMNKVVKGLSEGQPLARELASAGRFPPLMIQMISVGERTGSLEETLETVAQYYEEDVDVSLESLVSVIEPILMIVMGTVVGFIVLAMFLPILQMGTLARV